MFTQPSVNQIASAYQGNPAPLARKVDQDKKQNGGIPQDLRQLLALNDITQGRNAMGIQQALQTPTNMPTVAQDLQERARQALQARQMQQAQEMQRKNGMPNMVPPGTPRPPMQAQGLDTLESNVGEEYAHGGIIGDVAHFDKGGKTSQAGDLLRAIAESIGGGIEKTAQYGKIKSEREEAIPGFFEALTPQERDERLKRAALLSTQMGQVAEGGEPKTPYPQGGKPIPGNWDRPTGADDTAREVGMMLRQTPDALRAEAQAPAVAPTKKVNPNAQPQTRVNAPEAPGIAAALPPAQTEAYKKLTEMMNQDPEVKAQALRDRYMKEVGSRDLSVFDKTAAELQARKERLNAPKPGYEAMMEYLEQIAQGGGSTWMEAGAKGAAGQKALQKSRLAEQDTLMDKILEIGAKKSDAQFAEKKGMFDMTSKERDEIFKRAFDAAKSVDASDNEAKRLAAQAVENEKNRQKDLRVASIGAQDRDQLMNRAKALMAVDKTLTLEQAMTKASLAANASSVLSTESRDKSKGMEELRKLNTDIPVALRTGNSTFAKENRRQYETNLAALEAKYGPLTSGINTLPSAGGPTSSNVRSQADAIIAGGR